MAPPSITKDVHVPKNLHGKIIGKQAATLKDIESDFDAMNAVYDEYMAAIPLATEEAVVGAEYGDASSGGGDGAGGSRSGSLTTRQLPTRVCVGAALSGGFAVELRATAACCTANKGAILYTRARL